MHRFATLFVFLSLWLGSSAARAQSLPLAPASLPQIASGAPRTVVLPKLLIAGQRATLAVLDADGRLVPAVDVELSGAGRVTTGETGRAEFTAPAQTGVLTARITETGLDFTTTVLPASPELPQNSAASKKIPALPRLTFPRWIALQDRFDLIGSGFSGNVDLDHVVLGNLPALVLAASPVSLAVLPNPHTGLGSAELAAGLVGGRLDPQSVTVISLQITGPAEALSSEQKSALIVRVNGTAERLSVDVRSLTPEIVSLPQGSFARLLTSGGPSNVANVELVGVKPGDYIMNARLATAAGAIPVELARRQLLAARQIAGAAGQKSLDDLLRQMDDTVDHFQERSLENNSQRMARLQRELEGLLLGLPKEQVAAWLRLALASLGATD